MKTLVSVIVAGHKLYSFAQCVNAINLLNGECDVHFCIEKPFSNNNVELKLINDSINLIVDLLHKQRAFFIDYFSFDSTFRTKRSGTQDNTYRLPRIVTCRNFAISFAYDGRYDKILFVDSDVIVPRNTLEDLIALDMPIVGGIIPGRGKHGHVQYIFDKVLETDEYIKAGNGSCGCMMIDREVFSRLYFRYGDSNLLNKDSLECKNDDGSFSEDPCYCHDAIALNLADAMYLSKKVICQHLDNPSEPFV